NRPCRSPLTGLGDEASLHRPRGDLSAGREIKLAEDVRNVRFDGALAEHELFGDSTVRGAVRDESGDFALANGEAIKGPIGGGQRVTWWECQAGRLHEIIAQRSFGNRGGELV